MKAIFKPLGLAAAVAAAVGFAGTAVAQAERAAGNLGDLAIVPYYTVKDDLTTGIHIINSGATTQVVKVRLRRGSDSADALDINVVLSPFDHWAANIDDSSGNIVLSTDDTSCTAPLRANGRFEMSPIFREGADEGYIEIIGMGQPDDEDLPIAYAAKHVNGVPRDCEAVASNFFRNVGDPANGGAFDLSDVGNIDNFRTHQEASAGLVQQFIGAGAICVSSAGNIIPPGLPVTPGVCQTTYNSDDNPLKVAFHIRDQQSGVEFGGDAVHIANFSDVAWMTNQETGLLSGDIYGFDYPDLDGGPLVFVDPITADAGLRFQFEGLRANDVLGVSRLLNDWSTNPALGVSTDWVVTMPGQYTMLDFAVWAEVGFDTDECAKQDDPLVAGNQAVPACDFRDIPVGAALTLYDREEGVIEPEDGTLVISPQPPTEVNELNFPFEVNVVEWTDGSNDAVLGSEYATSVDSSVLGSVGWASLAVTPAVRADGQQICSLPVPFDLDDPANTANPRGVCNLVDPAGGVPITGFVAWKRSFPSTPDRSYGRLIDHSFNTTP